MVPVDKVGSATGVGSGGAGGRDQASEVAAAPVQRALVRIAPEPPAVSLRPADGRATAPFLAHLIATVQGAPQTRVRRRSDPNWATTTYATMMQKPASAGRTFRESR